MRSFVLLLLTVSACGPVAGDADLIITNGSVYTLGWPEPARDGSPSPEAPFDAAQGWHADAEAVASRAGRIIFVGSTADALRRRGASTRVFDAQGAAVLPGLHDAHVHLSNLGASLARVDLVGVATEEEAIRRIEARAKTTPAGEWIVGYGWDEGAWANHYPTMEPLSTRVPNHPVWLAGLHSFAGWGNRLAFQRAGITRATPAPAGGEIRTDVAGQPTGILLNNAVRLVEAAIPRPTAAEWESRMLRALDAIARAGYTGVTDATIDSEMLGALERLAAADRLPVRVWAMLAASDTALVRRWIERGPDTSGATRLTVRAVKAFYDGALGSRGALLLEDYADRPGHRGRGGMEIGFSEQLLAEAMGRGFQIVVHAIGDAANRQALDFFQRSLATHPAAREGRHRIEHAQVVSPVDLPRFASLGIVASVQPGHAVEDMVWAEQRIGPARAEGAYAWRGLRMAGARMVLSSDMPGSDYDFFYMLHAAITRRDRQLKPTAGWRATERLSPEEAVRGYTTWAAYVSFAEQELGQLTVGRLADITILDLDPFVVGSAAPDKLLNGRAVATIVEGKMVFERGEARLAVR
jgi:predicted amidohydrolase YtcJ